MNGRDIEPAGGRGVIPRAPAVLADPEDWEECPRPANDCTCDGQVPWCAVCKVSAAVYLAYQHPDSLSVSMLKRRIPLLTGECAAVLLEFAKRVRASVPQERRLQADAKVLLYSEAKALEAIRANPGMTMRELADALGLKRESLCHVVLRLKVGGDVRAEGAGNWRDPHRLYPTHDRPIVVHQRSQPVFKAYAP
jgi:hypothetical protein